MKKVKIMLTSIALLALVGGALAFKAKFSTSYCTTNTILDAQGAVTCPVSPGSCPELINHTTVGGTTNYCTTIKPAGGCANVVNCTFLKKLKSDL